MKLFKSALLVSTFAIALSACEPGGETAPGPLADAGPLAGDREVARNTESIPHPYPEPEAETFVERVRQQVGAGAAAVFAASASALAVLAV